MIYQCSEQERVGFRKSIEYLKFGEEFKLVYKTGRKVHTIWFKQNEKDSLDKKLAEAGISSFDRGIIKAKIIFETPKPGLRLVA